jgi:cyclopropane-fatty-acyl-phospholipid synthase
MLRAGAALPTSFCAKRRRRRAQTAPSGAPISLASGLLFHRMAHQLLRREVPAGTGSLERLRERPAVAPLVADLLGTPSGVSVRAWDGSRVTRRAPAAVRIALRSPRAVLRMLQRPGELGLARAYVAGDLEVDGDIFALAQLAERVERIRWRPWTLLALLRAVGLSVLRRVPPPPEEARLHGLRHSRRRDATAVSHHYDVSNEFFRIVLGPSMTYSCAVFADDGDTLEQAQERKHDLVCRKLGLGPGMRLLDVGCGWGSLLLHAAARYGVTGVGVTLSRPQAELATRRVLEAGLGDRVEIRVQDYRDVRDGPYDAIASIGMFEHVGLARLGLYFSRLFDLLRPGGRLLNHGISQGACFGNENDPRFRRAGFMDRYVFPDAELHEVGSVVSAVQRAGLDVCHVEGLRDHYARTLRRWTANLAAGWQEAVRHAGPARARIWRLYMAACAIGFEHDRTSIHQVLAVRPDGGPTGIPLRPDW